MEKTPEKISQENLEKPQEDSPGIIKSTVKTTQEQLEELFKQIEQKEEEIKIAEAKKRPKKEEEIRTKEKTMIQKSFSEGEELSINMRIDKFYDGKIYLPIDFKSNVFGKNTPIDNIKKYVDNMENYFTGLGMDYAKKERFISQNEESELSKETILKSKILQAHIKGFLTKVFYSSDNPYYDPDSLLNLLKLLTNKEIDSFHKFEDKEQIINRLVEILFKKIRDLIEKSKDIGDINKINKDLKILEKYLDLLGDRKPAFSEE